VRVEGLVGSVARTGEQCGQRVATHQLSRFVTLRAPSAPCPVLVMAMLLEMCVCACVSFPCVVTRTSLTHAERRVEGLL
jgi:hypothetical protein